MFNRLLAFVLILPFAAMLFAGDPALPPAKLDPAPKPLKSDPSVKLDYDIVYVRAPRFITGKDGKQRPSAWPEIGHPTNINAGYDLMLLHPDGSEEILIGGARDRSLTRTCRSMPSGFTTLTSTWESSAPARTFTRSTSRPGRSCD